MLLKKFVALNLENHHLTDVGKVSKPWMKYQTSLKKNVGCGRSLQIFGWCMRFHFWGSFGLRLWFKLDKKEANQRATRFLGKVFFQDGFKIHGFTIFNSQSPNLGFGSVESSWTGRALLTAQEKNPQLRNGFVHGFSWNMGFSVIGDPVKSSLILMESWHKIHDE